MKNLRDKRSSLFCSIEEEKFCIIDWENGLAYFVSTKTESFILLDKRSSLFGPSKEEFCVIEGTNALAYFVQRKNKNFMASLGKTRHLIWPQL